MDSSDVRDRYGHESCTYLYCIPGRHTREKAAVRFYPTAAFKSTAKILAALFYPINSVQLIEKCSDSNLFKAILYSLYPFNSAVF